LFSCIGRNAPGKIGKIAPELITGTACGRDNAMGRLKHGQRCLSAKHFYMVTFGGRVFTTYQYRLLY